MEPAFCISNCKFSASNSVKIVHSAPKIDFYGKNMKLPVQNQKSITDDFRAVYSYFVFPRVRCRFFAHLHQNKPKSLFCPIQERRKPSERGKNGMKVRFSRIFLQIGWSKRPQDIVFHFHHCVKPLPSRIPKKTSCRSHSWVLVPLFSKIVQRFCKNVCK